MRRLTRLTAVSTYHFFCPLFWQLENEKIVAQKERELELLRANAAKESEEQQVSTKTTYILQFLITVDKMEID